MSNQSEKTPPDYLIVGHITRDILDVGSRLGGTAVYSSILAQQMGMKVALFTSCESQLSLDCLDGIEIIIQESEKTTTFNNQYSDQGRKQFLLDRAPDLDLKQLPPSWRKSRIIHLAPIAGELSLASGALFPDSSVYYSLQGWLRDWDQDCLIKPVPLPEIDLEHPHPAGAFLSLEDLGNERVQLDRLSKLFPLLALTLGYSGAEIYQQQIMSLISAPATVEIDPTGSGDIFAAAFIIEKEIRGKSISDSARIATELAAISVTRPGIEGIPTIKEIQDIHKVH